MRLRTVVVLLIVVSIYRMISRDGYEAGVATQPAIDLLKSVKSSLKRVEARKRTYATNSFDGSSGPTVSSVSSVDEQGGNRGALLYSGLDGEKNVEEVSTPGAEPSASPVNHGYEQDVLSPNPLIFSNRSFSVEYLKDRLVYVTAISNNHFEEALGMFQSIEHCIPNTWFIVFDLSLNDKNREFLMEYHNVKIRPFPFHNYSHLPHVKDLFSYAWKPIMVQLVAQEYEVIMYLDSSMRMRSCDIKPSLAQLFKFPLFDLDPGKGHFVEFAHDGMLKYLHYPRERRDVAHISIHLRGCWILWVNNTIQEKLIKPWVDCALHRKCIAPRGARLSPCHFTSIHDGRYIGCHRYDQSALNVILAREFGAEALSKAINLSISQSTWYIEHM